MAVRLDKYLADMSDYSRKEVKKMIHDGRVMVNGQFAKDGQMKVELSDVVTVDGQRVAYVEYEYYLMNKPQGVICANEDNYNEVVFSLFESKRNDLSCVGRLDKDTVGALLITNDGQMNHRLLSEKNHVEKEYYFETDVNLPANAKELLEQPMDLGDFITNGAVFTQTGANSGKLIITQGKYHQVKRMLEKIGCTIVYLKRLRFAFLTCDDLEYSEVRPLSEEEIFKLKQL